MRLTRLLRVAQRVCEGTAEVVERLTGGKALQAEMVHELLAPIYNGFTEGFDTADLQEAKALREELVRGRGPG